MDYISANREAWEEAFENRCEGWGEDIPDRLKNEIYPFFEPDVINILKSYDLKDKTVAQFCSNNGRQLLSLVRNSGAKEGFGFDIAENQTEFANKKAKELEINCKFLQMNILDIGEEYYHKFDLILITIGVLCWFRDLNIFFEKVSKCLTENGLLLINEMHPMVNMFGIPGEGGFDVSDPLKLQHTYFKKEWMENNGMYYMTKKNYESKTFTSYTHPFSEIINAMCRAGLKILSMDEFDYDISDMFEHLDHKEVPLSFLLEAVIK